MKRILLSVPHMGGTEMQYVEEAFSTNWLSTVGVNLVEFEKAVEGWCGLPGVALASGTAGIHLGLRLLGAGIEDEVFCQSLTFAASTNPILYQGAKPVFIDSERRTWNMDPEVLRGALRARAAVGKLPRCVEVVHLFGQCAEMDNILSVCGEYGVPVLEDAAEAIGATYRGRPAGTMGAVGVYSFNGNKLLTTTSGGMLVSRDRAWVEKARFWSQQSRDPGVAYQHSELGYNYRMSNVLAGIGRGQMEVLDLRVAQRRAIAFRYRDGFADLSGLSLMPEAVHAFSTHWLSVFLVDEARFGCTRDGLIQALDSAGVESRPVWKPMHLQPVFSACRKFGGSVAEDLFRRGICLPSSSSLPVEDQLRVINAVRKTVSAARLDDLSEATEARVSQ